MTRLPIFAPRALGALLLVAAGAANANLLTNGSFESLGTYATPVGTQFPYYYPDSLNLTNLPGWQVQSEVHLIDEVGIVPQASDGRYYLDLTGVTGYDKVVSTAPVATGTTGKFEVAFDLGRLDALTFGNVSVQVSVNGTNAQTFVNQGADPTCPSWPNCSIDWKRFSFIFDATPNGFATIDFKGIANGTLSNENGILLDNVSVTAVPEPEAYTLALAAVGVLGTTAWRSKRGR